MVITYSPTDHTREFYPPPPRKPRGSFSTKRIQGDSSPLHNAHKGILLHCTQVNLFHRTQGKSSPLHKRKFFSTALKGNRLHCTQGNFFPLHTREIFSTAHKEILLHCPQGKSSPLHTRGFFPTEYTAGTVTDIYSGRFDFLSTGDQHYIP